MTDARLYDALTNFSKEWGRLGPSSKLTEEGAGRPHSLGTPLAPRCD
jgi:hypothetical protein